MPVRIITLVRDQKKYINKVHSPLICPPFSRQVILRRLEIAAEFTPQIAAKIACANGRLVSGISVCSSCYVDQNYF